MSQTVSEPFDSPRLYTCFGRYFLARRVSRSLATARPAALSHLHTLPYILVRPTVVMRARRDFLRPFASLPARVSQLGYSYRLAALSHLHTMPISRFALPSS